MAYRDYLRWEGGASLVLGAALALVAFPGLLVSYPAGWTGLLFVPAVLLALGLWARLRRGVALSRPGEWLTARSLAGALPGLAALPADRLERRLALETALWIVLVCSWVLVTGNSGLLVFGTGLASAAFGALQAFAARRHVGAVERATGRRFRIARRPGLGTPALTFDAAQSTSVAP